ncbi:MAG: hypothetical protein AB7O59_00530 [Pirellulales bacterium]
MRWQFRLRTVLLVVLVLCVALAIVSLKLRQDFRRQGAFDELARLEMRTRISADAAGNHLNLASGAAALGDDDVDRLVTQLKVLRSPHDLGWSTGLEIGEIDLSATRVTPATMERLRAALPGVRIKQ